MYESPEILAGLQQIIDRSAVSAGSSIKRNFIGGGWAMSAVEFVAFWGEGRMAAIATVSAAGTAHAVPLELRLVGGRFYAPTFPDSLRLRDHRANPRCAITSWDGTYRAVIVYGTAREVSHNLTRRIEAFAAEQGYSAGAMATVQITPTRIYAIRPPVGRRAG